MNKTTDKLIDDIIELILDDMDCHHEQDRDEDGVHLSVEYSLNNETKLRGMIGELIEQSMEKKKPENFPKIVCLCGSTRFTEAMLILQWGLTKQGFVVLSWCALPDSYFKGEDKHHIGDQEGVKEMVDEVHLRKIDLADEVIILNVGGYIGESTQNELNYAKKKGKIICFLEPEERK